MNFGVHVGGFLPPDQGPPTSEGLQAIPGTTGNERLRIRTAQEVRTKEGGNQPDMISMFEQKVNVENGWPPASEGDPGNKYKVAQKFDHERCE